MSLSTHLLRPSNLPSACNLCTVFQEFCHNIKDEYYSVRYGDREGVFESTLRLFEGPLNLFSSTFLSLDLSSKILMFFGALHIPQILLMPPLLTRLVPIAGIVLSGLELALEGFGLKTAYSLLQKIDIPPIDISEDEYKNRLDKTMQNIYRTFYEVDRRSLQAILKKKFPRNWENQEEGHIQIAREVKKRYLLRRIHNQDLLEELTGLFDQSVNATQDYVRIADTLQALKIQAQKKCLMHVLGLIAAIFSLVGLITSFWLFPATPLILLAVGSIFSIARYCISDGMMHKRKWSFDAANLIPYCCRRIYGIFANCCPRATH